MAAELPKGLSEACAPVVAVVDALEGVYGFPDDKPVNTTHFGPPHNFNNWPGLTWGDLRAIRAALSRLSGEG